MPIIGNFFLTARIDLSFIEEQDCIKASVGNKQKFSSKFLLFLSKASIFKYNSVFGVFNCSEFRRMEG